MGDLLIDIEVILERNRVWAERQTKAEPELFRTLARGQHPSLMWIGCSDSRVSPNLMMDLAPGQVFVYRNVANLVVPGNLGCAVALQFAIEELGVRRVAVGGHYGCGGVIASLEPPVGGPITDWLEPLRALRRSQQGELATLAGEPLVRRMCELNVIEQVRNVAATPVVSRAWQAGEDVEIYGLIDDIGKGLLRPVCRQTGEESFVIESGWRR